VTLVVHTTRISNCICHLRYSETCFGHFAAWDVRTV